MAMFSKSIFFITFLFFAMLTSISLTYAAEPAYIAVVDVQKLLGESKAAKDLQGKVKKHQEKFVKDLRKQEDGLRNQEKDLVEKRSSLSQDEFNKKRKEFEEELIKTRRSAQTRKRVLDKAASKSLNTLREHIFKIVGDIADEDGYNLILSRQNVILGANSIDVTDETLKRLNKAVKSIALEIEAN